MGTDIHGTFQKKIQVGEQTRWVDVSHNWTFGRNYVLFAALVGAPTVHLTYLQSHGVDTSVVRINGLPDDLQLVNGDHIQLTNPIETVFMGKTRTQSGLLFIGDHTHSWLYGELLIQWYHRNIDALNNLGVLKTPIVSLVDEVKRLTEEYGQIRMVFGFSV
jgi:hypothetical protein